jgi:hypothetical protein
MPPGVVLVLGREEERRTQRLRRAPAAQPGGLCSERIRQPSKQLRLFRCADFPTFVEKGSNHQLVREIFAEALAEVIALPRNAWAYDRQYVSLTKVRFLVGAGDDAVLGMPAWGRPCVRKPGSRP